MQTAALALKKVKRDRVRKGMVLAAVALAPAASWEFDAEIAILTHATTIAPRYQAVVHCEIVRQAARVIAMDRERLRSGDRATVRFRFIQRPGARAADLWVLCMPICCASPCCAHCSGCTGALARRAPLTTTADTPQRDGVLACLQSTSRRACASYFARAARRASASSSRRVVTAATCPRAAPSRRPRRPMPEARKPGRRGRGEGMQRVSSASVAEEAQSLQLSLFQ